MSSSHGNHLRDVIVAWLHDSKMRSSLQIYLFKITFRSAGTAVCNSRNEQAVVSRMLLIGIQKGRRVRHLLVHHSPTFLDIAIPMICKLPLAFTVHHRIISITVPIRTVDTDIQIEIHVDHRMLRECMLLEQKKRMLDCLCHG